jgi:transposase
VLEAMIAGQRGPEVLAGLARGKMRAKHDRLVKALTGRFHDHHAELARMLLDQIDALGASIDKITGRAAELIEAIPGAWAWTPAVSPARARAWAPARRCCPRSPAWTEVTGIGGPAAQVLIAEVGLNMSVHTHLTSRRSDLVQYLKSR